MRKRSKLKQMAAEGNQWAIDTLAKARAAAAEEHEADPLKAEAWRDAWDILKWRVGPKVQRWRVERLAKALIDVQRAR